MRRNQLTGAAIVSVLAATGATAFGQSTTPPADAASADPLATQSDDWAGYAHVGYHLDPHWRLELQGGYHADATSPALAPGAGFNPCADPLAGLACGPRDFGLGAYSMVANPRVRRGARKPLGRSVLLRSGRGSIGSTPARSP